MDQHVAQVAEGVAFRTTASDATVSSVLNNALRNWVASDSGPHVQLDTLEMPHDAKNCAAGCSIIYLP